MMTKAEAEREVVRRFHLLPEHERRNYEQADAYALRLTEEIEFDSFTDRRRLIAAWLIREVAKTRSLEDAHAA